MCTRVELYGSSSGHVAKKKTFVLVLYSYRIQARKDEFEDKEKVSVSCTCMSLCFKCKLMTVRAGPPVEEHEILSVNTTNQQYMILINLPSSLYRASLMSEIDGEKLGICEYMHNNEPRAGVEIRAYLHDLLYTKTIHDNLLF